MGNEVSKFICKVNNMEFYLYYNKLSKKYELYIYFIYEGKSIKYGEFKYEEEAYLMIDYIKKVYFIFVSGVF